MANIASHRYASPLIAELAINVALQLPLDVMGRGGKRISDRGIDTTRNSHFSDVWNFRTTLQPPCAARLVFLPRDCWTAAATRIASEDGVVFGKNSWFSFGMMRIVCFMNYPRG